MSNEEVFDTLGKYFETEKHSKKVMKIKVVERCIWKHNVCAKHNLHGVTT
jgi:hypothetical protein